MVGTRKRKKEVSQRMEQRRRQEASLAIQKEVEEVCKEMAQIMKEPICSSPDRVRELYTCLGDHQRALDKLIGAARSDEIITRIYSSIVKSQ